MDADITRSKSLTLIDILGNSKESDRTITFIDKADISFTYREVYSRAAILSAALAGRGVRKGDRLILLLEKDDHFIVALWASILAGIIAVPLPAARHSMGGIEAKRFENVYALLKTPVLCDHHIDDTHIAADKILRIETLITEAQIPAAPVSVTPDDIAIIQFSSGSTGVPKGVMLSHRNLIANCRQLISYNAITAEDISLSWMPYFHDMGLILFHFVFLAAGASQYKMSTAALIKSPLGWLRQISQRRATFVSATNFALELVVKQMHRLKTGDVDLSCVRCCYVAAEPISPKLLTGFLTMLKPHGLASSSVLPGYGLAEASVGAIVSPMNSEPVIVPVRRDGSRMVTETAADDDDRASVRYVDIGRPLPGLSVKIIDESGNEIGDGMIGEICIRGDNVMCGYFGIPAAETFLADGFFPTGDMGFRINGRYCITGRKKDIIFMYGKNYFASDVEDFIKSRGDGRFAYAHIVGVSDTREQREKVLLFFSTVPDVAEDAMKTLLADTQRECNMYMGFPITRFIAVARREIPKTTSGKVMRFELAKLYNDGHFDSNIVEL